MVAMSQCVRGFGMRLSKIGVCVLLATGGSQAIAADDVPAATRSAVELDTVEVVGMRSSLSTAQGIKREKIEIVDSIVASDINKLPDFSTTDALSRITGIQIARDRGEGGDAGGVPGASGVTIRGLTQMETLLNGREVFSAGTGRTLDFADIPAEMLAGIDVYKTSSAEHIEGGVGGTVDLRTHRPFDFKGNKLSGSLRGIYGDLVKKSEPQYSMLASSRWQSENHGEFGLLLNAAYQNRAWREDQKTTGNPFAPTNLAVTAPNGTSETTSVGKRERTAFDLVFQWKPTSVLELYAEASYAHFKTFQDSYQINVSPSSLTLPTFVAGSPVLFPGTNNLQSITWTNAPISILSFARDVVDETKQVAVGGVWAENATTIMADISRAESFNHLFFSGTSMRGTAANFTHNLSGTVPSTSVTGTNLLDPANFQYASVLYRERPYKSDSTAVRLDGEYQFVGSFMDTLSAGLRFARRKASNEPGLIFGDTPIPGGGVPASSMLGYTMQNPYGDFFPGYSGVSNHLIGALGNARDSVALRNTFGITAALPTAGSPVGVWRITDDTQAAYLSGKFYGMNMALDGNAGLRVVRTQEIFSGYQGPSAGPFTPINLNRSYIDYLPSANLRYMVGDGLYLRTSLSKTLTRPNFDQLSPSVMLTPNTIDPTKNQGSAGNPDLKPIRANNLDLAVERYFNATTSVSLTGFYKRVDGFVTTVSSPESYAGATYQVSRPQNSLAANIKGLELGYQQFYDFLPGWMSGLGLQANYTYVDSGMNNALLGQRVPLQNLSKHSYNVVGMYEKEKVSVRVAYNWRDRFLSGVANIVGVGALPIYTAAYGWLDASVTYRFDKELSIALEGTNLLRTERRSYYGVETRPQSVWRNDRQLGVTMTAKF